MLTDAVLVDRATAGIDGAFDELYRRHAQTAWRLAQSIARNADDAADGVAEAFALVLVAVRDRKLRDGDAFRAYLLTATRHATLDVLRRNGRAEAVADDELDRIPTTVASPSERVEGGTERDLVAAAFLDLPERWRSVLWLTEVEGIATKDAAQTLGMTPNSAAQLAVRARAGLRERYLQAHLRNGGAPKCQFTTERLGAYVGGGLSARDLAKVDQHLADCAGCKAKAAELKDVGVSLRRVALPLPIALAGVAASRVATALQAPAALPSLAARAIAAATQPTPLVRRLVGASAAGVLGIGLLAAGLLDQGNGAGARVAGSATAGRAAVTLPTAVLSASTLPEAALLPPAPVLPADPGTLSPDPAPALATTDGRRLFVVPDPFLVPPPPRPAPTDAPPPPPPPPADPQPEPTPPPVVIPPLTVEVPLLGPVAVVVAPTPAVSVGTVTVTSPVTVPAPAGGLFGG